MEPLVRISVFCGNSVQARADQHLQKRWLHLFSSAKKCRRVAAGWGCRAAGETADYVTVPAMPISKNPQRIS
jgi:hypothetical protein